MLINHLLISTVYILDNVKIEPQDTYDLVNNFEDVNQILESDLK